MNVFLLTGIMLILGYASGHFCRKIGLPKIIGYIATGVFFSPNLFAFTDSDFIDFTKPLMKICLAFITFEVGGALKWSLIRKHKKEIISVTFFASFMPFLMILFGFLIFAFFFPGFLPFAFQDLFLLTLLLGALASPTEPAATMAVMHQYKAKGKVSDTILGVAALDDIFGVLLFSLTLACIFIFINANPELTENTVLSTLFKLVGALAIGLIAGAAVGPIAKGLKIEKEGQWFVVIFSMIMIALGASSLFNVDVLLICLVMGMVVVNRCEEEKKVFKIIERYSEDLIFLFFFLLSGLHLNIYTIPHAIIFIILFVLLRGVGKFIGANIGARLVHADKLIQKYTAGGLLPQGGIVIGLVLNIYQNETFSAISELLLSIVMGAMVVHELLGPVVAKYSLQKAGEIKGEG